MHDETILDNPDGKISKLMELFELRDRDVWVVYHARYWDRVSLDKSISGFGYIPTSSSVIAPWNVGGFIKFNSGGGLKGFRPRREIDEEVMLLDGNEIDQPVARLLPLKEYQVGGRRLKYKIWSSMFVDQSSAEAYQVALAMMFDRTYPRSLDFPNYFRWAKPTMVKW